MCPDSNCRRRCRVRGTLLASAPGSAPVPIPTCGHTSDLPAVSAAVQLSISAAVAWISTRSRLVSARAKDMAPCAGLHAGDWSAIGAADATGVAVAGWEAGGCWLSPVAMGISRHISSASKESMRVVGAWVGGIRDPADSSLL